MRYALLIYSVPPEAEPSPEAQKAEMQRYNAFTREVNERGLYKGGEALEAANTATTVRVRNGKTLTTDGPFAETKEEFGGFYLIDAPDLDVAIEMAAKIPAVERGAIEIRPVWELPGEYSMAVAGASDARG